MNLTIKQLRAFAAVAREASFTRAAVKLHVTQSTLTAAIKALESEIGCRLLDRSTREVALTAQGEKFLPATDRLLRELSQSLQELQDTANRQRGFVVVAAAASFINYVLAPAVVQMAEIYPGIRVRLCDETTAGACRRVLAGEADFAVTTLFQDVEGLEASLVLTDAYGAVFSADHCLNDSTGPIKWSALDPNTVVKLDRANGIQALIEMNPKLMRSSLEPAYEVGSMSSLFPLLVRSLGYATLPAMAAQPLINAGLKFRPLQHPVLRRNLYFVTKHGRDLPPAGQALRQAMNDAIRKLAPNEHIRLVQHPANVFH
ncbi:MULTISPECIES: LysR family transcriptional regulator [unclassified Variovorax]|uniref:LysR family transcriptional regulator n=1 Tax=unclassified Variovorax TaxID=663243 RepID=UPI001BD29058|nr:MULTISPECIES: LysR family transcriptional regulator [unclassified Variovorax]